MFSVHTTPEKFETGHITLNTYQSPHYAGEISPVFVNLCFRETCSWKSRDYHDVIVYDKLRFQNAFRPHENEKPAFSTEFLRCEKRFRKVQVSWQINVEGRNNHLNKAAFSNSPVAVWRLRSWETVYFLCWAEKPSIENHKFRLLTPLPPPPPPHP